MTETEEEIAEIEFDLGLKPGFFTDLKKDEDWSFLIKAHTLMESVCSHLLSSYFSNTKFKEIFSSLEMSDTKKGKIAFLKAAGLINKEEARFISGLSKLRNETVHRIEGINFKFSAYIAKLDKNQRNSFVDNFGYAYITEDNLGNRTLKDREIIISDPKESIWRGVADILANIKRLGDTHWIEEQNIKARLKKYEMMKSNKSEQVT
jgi:hypothetical protein